MRWCGNARAATLALYGAAAQTPPYACRRCGLFGNRLVSKGGRSAGVAAVLDGLYSPSPRVATIEAQGEVCPSQADRGTQPDQGTR
jgi:hypothetical protein